MGIFKRFKKSNPTTSPSENADNAEQAAYSNKPPEDDIENRGAASTSAELSESVPDVASTEQQDYDRGNLWQRLQSGLKKTREVLKTDIRDLFKTDGQLVDDEFLKRLFAILVKTDMGGGPAEQIKSRIELKFAGRVIGPTTAAHQRPQSASAKRLTRAGETTAVMNAGTRTSAASMSLPA